MLAKNMTRKQYATRELEKALWRRSHGKIPKKKRKELAARTIKRIDFNNPLQAHKSFDGYADLLIEQFNNHH